MAAYPPQRRRPGPVSNSAFPHRIGIIVGLDLIGDALMKLPFLRAVRQAFPAAEVHWITALGKTAFASVLRDSTRELIDVIEECPPWIRGETVDGAPHFDLLIDTRNRWKLARHARRIPHGVFIAVALRYLLSDRRPPLFAPNPAHVLDRLLLAVALASGRTPVGDGALPVDASLVAVARTLLPEGHVLVGLATGAGNPVKIWPRERFIALARTQVERGRVPVFVLGPQEADDHAALAAAVPEARFPLQEYGAWRTRELGIQHTLAVASLFDVAVANDSGVGHMIAAVDCPLVSLFGPTSATKLAPRVRLGRVVRAQDFGADEMRAIPGAAVERAVDELLAAGVSRRRAP